jgi:hypothetical protein
MRDGLKEGFCLTVDKDGNCFRGFFMKDKKHGFGISDQLKDFYIKNKYELERPKGTF